ncbi:MAG: hypothetical protein WD939_10525 [Dehalococcoidia bacterium]
MTEPRDLVDEIERHVTLPEGHEERFSGYGIMGLPFASGHLLALRRFPASSLGAGYASVWHRDPQGRWTMFVDVPASRSCPRYFGSAVARATELPIAIDWTGDRSFRVSIDNGVDLRWSVSLGQPPVMKVLNAVGALMPDALWRRPAVLRAMGSVASLTLGAGRLGLSGFAPNGQRFIANPLRMWSIVKSAATLGGDDLGPLGKLSEQVHLGDFWIPQRGIFVIGRSFFEPFDSARHLAATSQATDA